MKTTKLGSGLAFTPEKDLLMFADMAAKGKRLTGIGAAGHGWTFEDARPEQAVFDLAYESAPSPDYFDIFRAAGWEPVLSTGDLHIFKASPGVTPVHSGKMSRWEETIRQRNRFAMYSLIALLVLFLAVTILRSVAWGLLVETSLATIAIFPVIYTVMPFLGYAYRAWSIKRS